MTELIERVAIDLAASLAAAISLLERGGKAAKKAAPSDKMFDQMLDDYRASLNRARKHFAIQGDHPTPQDLLNKAEAERDRAREELARVREMG